MEVEPIMRGEMGVTFLSRMYGPQVWEGDPNSCCDLPRQMVKFHTCVNLPPGITAEEKLLEKARAFYLTDKNTPVIGELVSKIVDLHGPIQMTDRTSLLRRWGSELDQTCQYPNVDCGWMEDYSYQSLGSSGFDFERFRNAIDSRMNISDFLTLPLCADTKPPQHRADVIVDEAVHLIDNDKTKKKKTHRKSPAARQHSAARSRSPA